jgi:hypothetical protein
MYHIGSLWNESAASSKTASLHPFKFFLVCCCSIFTARTSFLISKLPHRVCTPCHAVSRVYQQQQLAAQMQTINPPTLQPSNPPTLQLSTINPPTLQPSNPLTLNPPTLQPSALNPPTLNRISIATRGADFKRRAVQTTCPDHVLRMGYKIRTTDYQMLLPQGDSSAQRGTRQHRTCSDSSNDSCDTMVVFPCPVLPVTNVSSPGRCPLRILFNPPSALPNGTPAASTWFERCCLTLSEGDRRAGCVVSRLGHMEIRKGHRRAGCVVSRLGHMEMGWRSRIIP